MPVNASAGVFGSLRSSFSLLSPGRRKSASAEPDESHQSSNHVIVWRLRPETARASAASGTASPALELFAKWKDEEAADVAMRSRFKLILTVVNTDVIDFLPKSAMDAVLKVNGKPILIKKATTAYGTYSADVVAAAAAAAAADAEAAAAADAEAAAAAAAAAAGGAAGGAAADADADADGTAGAAEAGAAAADAEGDAAAATPPTPPSPYASVPTTYAEVGVDPRTFNFMLIQTLDLSRENVPKFHVNLAVVIEARADPEMPECVLGAVHVRGVECIPTSVDAVATLIEGDGESL